MWVWSLGQEDPLEKGLATHSSILAWRIPWTEKPSRLQSMRSQRVRHDWATLPSPALTGGFLTISTTWEAIQKFIGKNYIYVHTQLDQILLLKKFTPWPGHTYKGSWAGTSACLWAELLSTEPTSLILPHWREGHCPLIQVLMIQGLQDNQAAGWGADNCLV